LNLQNRWSRWALRLVAPVLLAAMTGCISTAHFVDMHVKDVDAAQFHKPDPIHPVQLLFNFKTKGADNARATATLKARVGEQVWQSGLFDKVSDTPVAGGALLVITVDNVPQTNDATAKGVATGLTLGLAGTAVADGYTATASYTPPGVAQPIVKEFHHAIYTTIGNHAPPPDAVPVASTDEAVTKMLHQVVSNLLNDVSHDPSFK
jgi:hypothetical protein